jgi:hypothetical protein
MLCALMCLALVAPTFGQTQEMTRAATATAVGTQTLNQALEAAWQRSLEASESRSRYARAQADQAITQSWLASAPSVSLGQRAGASEASRETELGLALPLWWPGQRAAAGQEAQSQLGSVQATAQAERLRLAGRLREAMGALHLAEAELQQV